MCLIGCQNVVNEGVQGNLQTNMTTLHRASQAQCKKGLQALAVVTDALVSSNRLVGDIWLRL